MAETQSTGAAAEPRLRVRNAKDVPERVGRGAVRGRTIFTSSDTSFESSLHAVLHNSIPAGEVNERHVHADVEKVYFFIRGEAEIECGPWSEHASAGDFLFFPAAIPHRIRSLGPDDLEFVVVQSKVTSPPRGIDQA